MAELELVEFVNAIRDACDRSSLVTGYDVRIQDNATVKIRIFLSALAFIDTYFNPANGNCTFALIQEGQRIYGADNAFVGWHVHPFDDPEHHLPSNEVTFAEFLRTIEKWAARQQEE